nr:ribonuclease H-like domain-containing protein [Tanacetum cinerariifolium]
MMGLLNEHQLKFNSFKDAKLLLEALEKSTNTQNKAFVSSSSNNSNNSNGVNNAQGVNTANKVNTASSQINAASSLIINNLSDVVVCAFVASQPNNTQLVNEDPEQIYPDDLEHMDLKWKDSDAPIIEDWVSDDEEEMVEKQEVKPSINRINFVKATTDNNPRETVQNGEQPKQNTHRKRAANAAKAKAKHKAVKEKMGNVVKASACWEHLQDKGVINNGCSRHMIGNMSFLIDYEEIDRDMLPLEEILKERILQAKDIEDESKLWHRRLGHLKFKTINKLVKGNLVRGLPSKIFK